jgi:hypothetical protein
MYLGMPPIQQLLLQQGEAESAAGKLSTLLKTANVEQLLQHPPPAVPTEQQQDLLHSFWVALTRVLAVLAKAQVQGSGQVGPQPNCMPY